MTAPKGAPLVLLQSSDWHVGSALTGHGLSWPSELRAVRQFEIDGAAERAVRAAIEVEADGLLVPGDLWDAECVPAATLHRLLEAFAAFAPRPVFIAPGNHDFAGPGGWYDPAVLSALGMRAWPDNVIVFRDSRWATVPFPGRPDVAVVGRAFPSAALAAERPLAQSPAHPGTTHSLLLLHGSYEQYDGFDAPTGGKRVAPFSRAELLAAGFSWAALGHHHHMQVVADDSGRPRAAYSGCPSGRGLDETGPRVFLKVTLDVEGTTVETLPADSRLIREVAVDVGELEGREIAERVEAALDRSGATTADVVRITLLGTQVYGSRASAALGACASRVAHLVIRDRTVRPTSDVPGVRTAEGRFIADLLARREQAHDEAGRRVIDLALTLGRDALAGRALVPP
ncbi:MAG: metallophosphoesterase, partial [Thermoanaerobaculia bacterium]